jgi:hypothetical protein
MCGVDSAIDATPVSDKKQPLNINAEVLFLAYCSSLTICHACQKGSVILESASQAA